MFPFNRSKTVYKLSVPAVRYAEFIGGQDSECGDIFRIDDESIEELAQLACPHIIAIRTFKSLSGTAKVSGNTVVAVTSDRFEVTPCVFLDAEALTIDQLMDKATTPRQVYAAVMLKALGLKQVVLCCNGQHKPFHPEDGETVLSLRTAGEDSEEDSDDENDWGEIPDEAAPAEQNAAEGNPDETAAPQAREDTPPAEEAAASAKDVPPAPAA